MLPPSTGLSRETNDNFQELCNKFADGILSRNPREVTLFGFPSLYSKKWKLTGVKQVPQFNYTIQYSFISAQHICSVHVMSNIVVDIYINAGLGDSY